MRRIVVGRRGIGGHAISGPRAWSRWTALLLAAVLAYGCMDDTLAPETEPGPTPPAEAQRVLGLVELTFTGIGTPEFSSSVLVAPSLGALEELRAERDRRGGSDEAVAFDLAPPSNASSGGNGTIQLAPLLRNRFEHDGIRYLSTRLRVRNAQVDGTAYDTPRNNVTFLAVGTDGTINGTAVRRLELANGAQAPASLALEVMPTVRVESSGNSLAVPDPDVLQILSEDELTDLLSNVPSGVTNVFPYGFVVRRAGDNTTRELPASPAPNDFDGVIDFAFSIPLQPSPAEDPEKLSLLFLAVDDSETRVTQGLQEQNPADRAALQQRAISLGADMVTLLPGGSLAFSSLRTLCSVRTAGPAGAATAHLVNVADSAFQSFSPAPYATGGGANHIPSTSRFEATFAVPTNGAGPATFTVRGLQSGWSFLGQTYAGNGSPLITTPAASFAAGEEVEIALTNTLSCPSPVVARYRVQSATASGNFSAPSSFPTFPGATSVALGDLRGNGTLDAVVTTFATNNFEVSIYLGNSDGSFQSQQSLPMGGFIPSQVALADLDKNSTLDIVVTGADDVGASPGAVGVLLGNGDGTFQTLNTFTVGGGLPGPLAIGDLNGDGILDVVTGNSVSNDISSLLGNGDGTFQAPLHFSVFGEPSDLALGDMSGQSAFAGPDGILDIAALIDLDPSVVWGIPGTGDGTFGGPFFTDAFTDATLHAIAIGDMTGDGIPDIVTANSTADTSNIFLIPMPVGLGQTAFSLNTVNEPQDVSVADLTGDGLLDVVTANASSDPTQADISALVGSVFGSFQPAQTFATGGNGASVAVGSLRSNGVLDVVTVGDDRMRVLLGLGSP